MKKQLLSSVLAVGTLAIGCLGQVSSAEALSFGFQNIPSDNSSGDNLANNFLVDVTDASNQTTSKVLFKFANNGTHISNRNFITRVFFDGFSNLLSSPVFNVDNTSVNGVDFARITNPNNLNFAQGENLNPDFVADFGAREDGQGNNNSIHGQETLGIRFNGNYNAVIAALNSGDLRVGLRVQGIGSNGNGSDSFVNNPNPIPTPALLPGLIGMGAAALRKKKREDGTEEVAQEA